MLHAWNTFDLKFTHMFIYHGASENVNLQFLLGEDDDVDAWDGMGQTQKVHPRADEIHFDSMGSMGVMACHMSNPLTRVLYGTMRFFF